MFGVCCSHGVQEAVSHSLHCQCPFFALCDRRSAIYPLHCFAFPLFCIMPLHVNTRAGGVLRAYRRAEIERFSQRGSLRVNWLSRRFGCVWLIGLVFKAQTDNRCLGLSCRLPSQGPVPLPLSGCWLFFQAVRCTLFDSQPGCTIQSSFSSKGSPPRCRDLRSSHVLRTTHARGRANQALHRIRVL